MAVNLASKYSSKLATVFTMASITEGKMNEDYNWNGNKMISVLTPTTTALVDYTRDGVSRFGTPSEMQDTKQDLAITKDKAFTFTVDKGNLVQQEFAKQTGKVTKAQIEEQVVPYIDTLRLTTWATAAGHKETGVSLDKDTVYSELVKARAYFVNHKVPMTNVYAYVNTEAYALLLQNPLFVSADAKNISANTIEKGIVGTCAGFKIVETPDEYLGTVAILCVNKASVMGPKQLETLRSHTDAPGIDGALVEGRYLTDAFVLEAKKDGVYSIATA